MTSALDTSLEDLIKKNKQQKKSEGGNSRDQGRRGSAAGPARRASTRSSRRAAPYTTGKAPKAPDTQWQHDMYQEPGEVLPEQGGKKAASIETGTKIYVSNLDYGVSNDDIKDLFSEVGDLKRFSVHYDRSGRSKGTAEVVFARRADAATAVERYNNVQLDGKPMKIEIVGTNIGTSLPSNPPPKREPARDGATGASRGSRRRRGRGRRKSGNERSDPLSSADLDAELEKYHSESMQIN
ncbi:THO complex subunit 4A-like isoform X2 [Wolffia australiana]